MGAERPFRWRLHRGAWRRGRSDPGLALHPAPGAGVEDLATSRPDRLPEAPPAPTLRLLGSPADDGVTALRAEVKFAVHAADLDKLRTILATNFERRVYNQPVSRVSSIYFDDWGMSAACENLAGHDRRTKVRLRWYDRPDPGTRVFLEIKRRMSRMIGKDRFEIDSRVPIADMTYERLQAALLAVLPGRIAETLMLRPDPILINSYQREHFAVPGSPIRVTLDYAIECSSQVGRVRPAHRFPVPLHDLVVIEGKAPRGRETELRPLLLPLTLRVTRCSKYVQGCQALGLAATSAGLTDD